MSAICGKRCGRVWVRLLCALCLLASPAWAADTVLDVARLDAGSIPLAGYFGVLEDPGQSLSLADVQTAATASRFQGRPASAVDLGFGFTRSAWWLRLVLRNTSDQPVERMLEIAHARISSVQFYQPGALGDDAVRTGNVMPFATRAYPNRGYVLPVQVAAHAEQVVFIRLQSLATLVVPARLWTPQAFHAHERADYAGQAWYFGMAAAMIAFNLLLFIALRDTIYLLYVNVVTGMAFTLAAQNGLTKEFLWQDAPLWSDLSFIAANAFTFVSVLVFMRHMLNTRVLIPKLEPVLKILVALFVLTPIALAVDYQGLVRGSTLLQAVTLVLILATGVYAAYQRQRSAYFFVAAFAAPLFGAVLMLLRNVGLLPTHFLTVNAMQIGSAVEMLLLALALADRFNVLRREKETAQTEALRAEHRLVASLKSSELVLEQRVAERTGQLQILNAKLETLSSTDALTGIANRRRFDAVLAQEWSRSARLEQPLAVALVDVDWFKNYNDHYGHQAGDACLQSIAQCLAATICRSGDLVARYGGEEFVFIAPNTDASSSLGMASKVCEAIAALALPHQTGHVTVSIGVASLVPAERDTPGHLLKNADSALYQAKAQGRNRAVGSDGLALSRL